MACGRVPARLRRGKGKKDVLTYHKWHSLSYGWQSSVDIAYIVLGIHYTHSW